jgi:transglutaminase-like putative cysteine protease
MIVPLLIALAAAMPTTPSDEVRFVLVAREAKRVEATLTWRVQAPDLRAQEWIVFVAEAPELAGQTNVKTTTEPKAIGMKEKSPLHRAVSRLRMTAKTPEQKTSFELKAVYEASLRSRHLRPLTAGQETPAVADLTQVERRNALLALGNIDHDDTDFRRWMKSESFIRETSESDVEFARRVFLNIRSQFAYEYKEDKDRHASKVCQSKKSDCGGLSSVFVSVLRANGIPARALYGRWALSARPAEKLNGMPFYQWHVKSEFFAQGIGWVPVDISSGILHDKSTEGLRFFGHDPGDFLTLHVDSALELDTARFGQRQVENLQEPSYFVFGGGTVTPSTITEDWKVRRLP